MEDIVVRGVSVDKDEVKITLAGVPDYPGVAARLFKDLAGASINIDMIVQNISAQGITDISFTIPEEDLAKTQRVLQTAAKGVGVQAVNVDADIAKVSIVGVGMRGHSGVAFQMFKTLAEQGINILMISTSEIKVSVIVRKALADKAMIALHKAFRLDKSRVARGKSVAKAKVRRK